MTESLENIRNAILVGLPEAEVHIFDPRQDGQHLEALVICSRFEDLRLVQQHQLVMRALKAAFAGPLHALALKTFTPEAWDAVRNDYLD